MFRTKGSTTPLARGSRWAQNDVPTEEAGFYNEVRQMSGRLEEVPLSQDERIWIRVPVSMFMFLIYNPMSWLFRPFRPIFTTPHGLVGLLIFFLLVLIPLFVTSGCLASITKPHPHNHSK
ncbi:unnamed protein product [Fusarium graminearum]|uniref:Uncharacterized protein n=1 Tax=Gibberella zeae TaxID=5518 RepID=A0A4U9ES06_GIBZA|nr:unnamed protein product [Fusarium graminearum]CAG1987969.1 unnamed protein product [Fusarium graminearum]CAG1989311.1 unnamed protein product [Fusarium graminearum]CAG2007339.1 unnamed protein product [Fusarium graminearum]VTO83380.1 unnamed protein product [Fusarium graminearum]